MEKSVTTLLSIAGLTAAGDVLKLAGTTGQPGFNTGSNLNYPYGMDLFVDSTSGNYTFYVADYQNSAIVTILVPTGGPVGSITARQ